MYALLARYPALDRFDRRVSALMGHVGIATLRIAVALVFIWFGGLKLVEGLSPAEDLVKATVYWVNPDIFFPILGAWEVLIGVGLLWRPLVRGALFLLALQMP
ncbi:MAG: hypothetical protein AAFN13_07505, partial [Bacteroidota bacterium]